MYLDKYTFYHKGKWSRLLAYLQKGIYSIQTTNKNTEYYRNTRHESYTKYNPVGHGTYPTYAVCPVRQVLRTH